MSKPDWPSLIRHADAQDASYVRNTWTSSYRNSPWRGTYVDSDHDSICNKTILHLIKRGARVAVVANPTNTNLLLGWICYELDLDQKPVLHYLFVKPLYRRQGIAQSLIKHAGIDLDGEFFYTHKTPVCGKVLKNGKYRPEIARKESIGRKRETSYPGTLVKDANH